MKNVTIIIFSLLTLTFNAHSQPLDSASVKKMIDSGVSQVVKAIEKVAATSKDTTATTTIKPPAITLCTPIVNLLTLMPVLFYVITLLVVSSKLKKEGAKLSWFLVDKELIAQLGKQTAQVETARLQAIAKAPTPDVAATLAARLAPPALQDLEGDGNPIPAPADNKESVSRLIALLTGLITLGIASCLTSFYIYKSFTGHPDIDLGKIATVLFGLGLGLVPYGFSKVAGVLK
jgi:hypothetical protein